MTTWTMPWNTAAAEAVTKATPYTDAVSSATPLAALRLAESAWQRGLNVDLPSLSALFWGNVGGSLGETCVPALLLGGIYLLWRGHIDWRIPAGYIARLSLLLLFTAGCANIRPGLPFIICFPAADHRRLFYGY